MQHISKKVLAKPSRKSSSQSHPSEKTLVSEMGHTQSLAGNFSLEVWPQLKCCDGFGGSAAMAHNYATQSKRSELHISFFFNIIVQSIANFPHPPSLTPSTPFLPPLQAFPALMFVHWLCIYELHIFMVATIS